MMKGFAVTVQTGLEVVLRDGHEALADKRIGLITNHTAVDVHLRSASDLFATDDRWSLVALFGPEHGVRGAAQAGDHVGTERDPRTGVPAHSLYGETRQPTPEMLENIEALVFDIQDAGARFYTYISTMALCLESASEAGLPFIILDRPNPITGKHREGPVLNPDYRSFVGTHPIPTRHGLTMGELGRLIARDRGLTAPIVIACDEWQRSMWWSDTGLPFIPPSPNLPTTASVGVYPGTCIFEATTMSEGRGTTLPFEVIGAPWVDADAIAADLNGRDLPGARFRPTWFTPTFSKHEGIPCAGVQVHVIDREAFRPVATGVHMVHAFKHQAGSEFAWRPGQALGMSANLLYGRDDLHEMIDAGADAAEIIALWDEPLAAFDANLDDVLLYR